MLNLAANLTSPRIADTASRVDTLDPEEVFRRYTGYVATIAVRLMGRNDDVDDVIQDVFLEAIRGLRSVRDPQAIRGWLATVTTRIVRRRLRMKKVRQFFGLEDEGAEEVVAPDASPEHRLLLVRLYKTLAKLPVDQRLAWSLRHIEGEALEDVASMCGCSLATVKRRITAAQTIIEQELGT